MMDRQAKRAIRPEECGLELEDPCGVDGSLGGHAAGDGRSRGASSFQQGLILGCLVVGTAGIWAMVAWTVAQLWSRLFG
jgi:hypothetical protein